MTTAKAVKTATATAPPALAAEDGPVLVFAYGTLRPSLYPEKAARFSLSLVGRGQIHGQWQMHNLGNFPGLVKTTPTGHPDDGAIIVGEVVEAPSLANLDAYEGYPRLYRREVIDVRLDDNRQVQAWVYTFARHKELVDCPVVTTGDWADVVAARH